MTKLTKPVSRESAKIIGKLPVVITIAPCGSQSEARIGLRLKGRRTAYTATVSDLYRVLAIWHGQKLSMAKKQARKEGVAWRIAKRQFDLQNKV